MLTPAQVNAAIAHVRRLKRNQPQGKLTLSLDMGTRIKTSQKQEGSAIKHPLRFNLLKGFYSMPPNLLSTREILMNRQSGVVVIQGQFSKVFLREGF
jgi:hypothetical protein